MPSMVNHDPFSDNLALPSAKSLHQQKITGQHLTPWSVCDLMLAFSLNLDDLPQKILDPGCGNGHFLLRAAKMLAHQQVDCPTQYLYGVEMNPEDAQRTILNLQNATHQNLANTTPSIQTLQAQIYAGDFLASLPPLFQAFDLIIGNPPYVRSEHQRKPKNTSSPSDWVSFFQSYVEEHPKQKGLFTTSQDLYIQFILKAAFLLKPGGTLCFVVSNSWLNTQAGKPLQAFLHNHFHIEMLLESNCENWFDTAAIRPVILVLKRRKTTQDKHPSNKSKETVRLVRLKKPLSKLLPAPNHLRYHEQLQDWVKSINDIHKDHLESDTFSITTVPTTMLTKKNAPLPWSFYLRTTPTLYKLFEKAPKDCKTPLAHFGKVRYPLKTGINAFFYVSSQTIAQFQIEPEFLIPVIKSTRHIQQLPINPAELDQFLFSCPLTTQELKAAGKTGALNYIQWGETQSAPPRQKRFQPVRWPQVASVRHRQYWYQLPHLEPPHILACRFYHQRYFFPFIQQNPEVRLCEDQTFYGILLTDRHQPHQSLLSAILNSLWTYTLLELTGRTSLGDGILQFSRQDMANLPILSPECFSVEEEQRLMESFQHICTRPILPASQELAQPDRTELDRLVLSKVLMLDAITSATLPKIDAARQHLTQTLLSRQSERTQKIPEHRRQQNTTQK